MERLEAMMAKRAECQQCLAALAEEQEAFLKDMRTFARVHAMAGTAGVEAPRIELRRVASSSANAPAETEETEESVPAGDGPVPPLQASPVQGSLVDSELHRMWEPAALFPSEPASVDPDRHLMRTETDRMRMTIISTEGVLQSLMTRSSVNSDLSGRTADHLYRRSQAVAKAVLQAAYFEPAMGIVILFNAANIGWTIDRELQGQDISTASTIEAVILFVFMAELVLRFYAEGCRCLWSVWNALDFMLISMTGLMLLLPSDASGEGSSNTMLEVMNPMLLLRMLRLMRLARAMRFVKCCRPLWKLVQGLLHCMVTMASAFVLLFLAIYLFACFGAELITKAYRDDPKVGTIVAEHYSSLPLIIMTLCQFVSMDSTASVYVPLVTHNPALAVYFLLLVLIVTIALMNLITAVVVDNAISTAQMDNAMKRHLLRSRLKRVRPAFEELFNEIDAATDGNGVLEVRAIVEAFKAGVEIPKEIRSYVTRSRLLDFFDLLDQNADGGLTETEFVDGLSCLVLSDVPVEMMQILHVLRSMRRGIALLTDSKMGCASLQTASLLSQSAARQTDSAGSSPMPGLSAMADLQQLEGAQDSAGEGPVPGLSATATSRELVHAQDEVPCSREQVEI